MITLADDLIDYNLPLLLVIPKKKDFSMEEMEKISQSHKSHKFENDKTDEESNLNDENNEKKIKKDRKALIIGLGDLIIPTIFVVSSNVYMGLIPSLGAIIGGTIGLFLLLRDIGNSKPKAGLPFLNGGVILGFLITLLLINII
jgi:presenilin-like A22 family membrane protease